MTGSLHTPLDYDLVDTLHGELVGRLESVQARIAAAGGEQVQLLAVSKGHPVEAVAAGLRAGLSTFGENYAQELAAKAGVLDQDPAICTTISTSATAGPIWHFIGQLQTNKVRHVAGTVAVWQSVDRARVANEIAKRAPAATVFAQVNLSEDPNKAGCNFDDLPALINHLQSQGLVVDGLMGVGTAADDQATVRGFSRLRLNTDRYRLTHCSMGMTEDLEIAVREGSTMVRVGTALFGARPALDTDPPLPR